MRVTCILKDFSDEFYNGFGDSIPAFLLQSPHEQFEACRRLAQDKRASMKIGTGQLRDAVELNSLRKRPHSITCEVLPRRGYKLAVFEITGTRV